MKIKYKIIWMTLIIKVFFISDCYSIGKMPEPFLIVPQPQKVEFTNGIGLEFGDLVNVEINGNFERPVMGPILSKLPSNSIKKGGVVKLMLESNANVPESREGYILTILDGHVEIISRGLAGLFYGCQTLEQLLEDARDYNVAIPACRITDYPILEYRAVQIDVKNHLDHMNIYYKAIDKLAKLKINSIIFEFEDKLAYQRRSVVGLPNAISIDEMSSLTKYARDRHIDLSPLVQGLGHASFILKHDEFKHLREDERSYWAFCPKDEGTYEVLFDLYADAIDATPGSKYLHVGGDEVGNIGICDRCRSSAEKDGMLALYLYWINRVCEYAIANDRIPILWDDILLGYSGVYNSTLIDPASSEHLERTWRKGEEKLKELLPLFPKDAVYMRWNYSMATQLGNIKAIDWYNNQELNVIAATAAQSGYAPFYPFDGRTNSIGDRGVPAIKSFVEIASDKELKGMICTAWDDLSPHMEMHWRGFLTAANSAWSPKSLNIDELDVAYLHRFYGLKYNDYASLYGQLRKASKFWETAYIESSRRHDWKNNLIDLPDLNYPGDWQAKYADKLELAKEQLSIYEITSKAITELKTNSLRNRYHWEVIESINNFLMAAPKLLVAMEKFDNEVAQVDGFDEIINALNYFDVMWGNLNKTYSKTRFVLDPIPSKIINNFKTVPKRKENLAWMIAVERTFFQNIKEWLIANNTFHSTYFLKKKSSVIALDGFASEEGWVDIPEVKLLWPWEQSDKGSSKFKAFVYDKKMFCLFDVEDNTPVINREIESERELDLSDRVEIYFSKNSDMKEYYCIEVDPFGKIQDYKASYYRKFDYEWQAKGVQTATIITNKGYRVELSIPLRLIESFGVNLNENFYVGLFQANLKNYDGELNESWASWIDPYTETPDFHVPETFGVFKIIE